MRRPHHVAALGLTSRCAALKRSEQGGVSLMSDPSGAPPMSAAVDPPRPCGESALRLSNIATRGSPGIWCGRLIERGYAAGFPRGELVRSALPNCVAYCKTGGPVVGGGPRGVGRGGRHRPGGPSRVHTPPAGPQIEWENARKREVVHLDSWWRSIARWRMEACSRQCRRAAHGVMRRAAPAASLFITGEIA